MGDRAPRPAEDKLTPEPSAMFQRQPKTPRPRVGEAGVTHPRELLGSSVTRNPRPAQDPLAPTALGAQVKARRAAPHLSRPCPSPNPEQKFE